MSPEELERFPLVMLTFADHGGTKYVACSGHAALSNNRAKIKGLWSPFAKAWWASSPAAGRPACGVFHAAERE